MGEKKNLLIESLKPTHQKVIASIIGGLLSFFYIVIVPYPIERFLFFFYESLPDNMLSFLLVSFIFSFIIIYLFMTIWDLIGKIYQKRKLLAHSIFLTILSIWYNFLFIAGGYDGLDYGELFFEHLFLYGIIIGLSFLAFFILENLIKHFVSIPKGKDAKIFLNGVLRILEVVAAWFITMFFAVIVILLVIGLF